ncbi:hypothetical protein QAD02_008605 [Eretmocerus hayati]|uniref:Uncharacterized protein n=1 Tax=Eretmocerus hayati TaxID=131215 RepID=A0ACC2N7K5_9HYME|nr:hypothetical protein QAD02_008605 [Eretmocerus hayati]
MDIEDDDYDSNASSEDERYLRGLYESLSASRSFGEDFDANGNSDEESDSDDAWFPYRDDPSDVTDEDDTFMSLDSDSGDSEALSEASTMLNEDHPEQDQSGTDTEVDEAEEGDQAPVEVPDQVNEVIIPAEEVILLSDDTDKEVATIADESLTEDQRCPICLEIWSNAGEHRLCSLRCGHLFGLKCIQQWFNVAPNANARKCPECNTKASKKDIRVLYAKSYLRCLDTSEVEKLREQLKDTAEKKDKAEKMLELYKSKEVLYEQQLTSMKHRISDLEKTVKAISSDRNSFSGQIDSAALQKSKIFDICKDSSCRVMAYSPWHRILLVSTNSSYKRISVDSLIAGSTYSIHSGPIRDMAFQQQNCNILLSVGVDKRVVLSDMRNNRVTHSYTEDSPLWSCSWSNHDSQRLFVGGARGKISEYDIRFLDTSLSVKENSDRSPVASLASVPPTSPGFCAGGLLSCQLGSCHAYAFKEGDYVDNQINIEGPFTSLRYDDKHNHALLSCRASSKNPSVRHLVVSLDKNDDKIQFNTVHSFDAGNKQTFLSRSGFMNLAKDTMVMAYNENLKSILAWSISTGQEAYKLPVPDQVVDLCSFENGAVCQAVLTLNKVHFYHYKNTSV